MLNITPQVSASALTSGVIQRVQSASGNTGNAPAASYTITFSGALTPGNLVVIAWATSSSSEIIVSDSLSARAFNCGSNQGGSIMRSGISFLIAQAADTVLTCTTNAGGTTGSGAVAVEYSGASLRVDSPVQTTVASASTTNQCGTITTRFGNELLVASLGQRLAFTSEQTSWLTAPTNSFSSVLQTSSFANNIATDRAVAFLERIVSAAGSYSTAGTQSSGVYANCIASFVSS
jgi:hypothetical protein